MTKILFVGDSHGNIPYIERAFDVASDNEVDLIIGLGDFGWWPGPEGKVFLDAVRGFCSDSQLPFWSVEGNHDFPGDVEDVNGYIWDSVDEPTLEPTLQHLPRGTVVDLDGYKTCFFGGAVSVDQRFRVLHRSYWRSEVLSQADVEKLMAVGPVDIMVTHDAVFMPPMAAKRWFGEPADSQISIQAHNMSRVFHVMKPRVHVHGHWHMRYSAPTEYGKVIGLDFESDGGLLLTTPEELISFGSK